MGSSSLPIGLSPEQLHLRASLQFVPTDALTPQETVNAARSNAVRQAIERDQYLRHPLYVTGICDRGPLSILDGHNRWEAFRNLGFRNVLVQYVPARKIDSATWIQVSSGVDPLLGYLRRHGLQIAESEMGGHWRASELCFIHTARKLYRVSVQPDQPLKVIDCTRIVTDALAEGQEGVERISDDELPRLLEHLDGRVAVQFRPVSLDDVLAAVSRGERIGAGVTRFGIPDRIVDVDLPIGPWINRPVAELNGMLAQAIERSSPRKYCNHIMEAGIAWPVTRPKSATPIAESTLQSHIGNTRLLPLESSHRGNGSSTVFAKCEFDNLSGSSKARPAELMIREAGEGHLLDAGSGSTGQAEAEIAAHLGRKLTIVVPENIPPEKIRAIRKHATVVTSPADQGSEGARALAMRINSAHPGKYIFLDQYSNTANWRSHFATADEIFDQTQGRVAHVFAGIGTGGTCMGLSRGLKGRNAAVKIHGVMPLIPHHQLYGLKFVTAANTPSILDLAELDDVIHVSDDDAYSAVRVLAREKGLIVGPSSGAVYAAWSSKRNSLTEGVVVLIFHDTGDKYQDLFSAYEMKEYSNA